MNEGDKAFQSRYLLLQFGALATPEDTDPNLYSNWLMIRELLSALTPDFSMLLHNGKLDRDAIQDCAAFLQAAIGRKRDRNANMWGILLYFMLLLNVLFQSGAEEQKQVFVWMVKSVTRSSYELNNHTSVLEQFVIAVHKIQTTHANPLGREHETLFWHNYRTTCSPSAAIFNGANSPRFYAFRLDAVCTVIKNVLGRTFSAVEIHRMIDDSMWATKGKAQFYDITTNSWPIAHTVHDDATNTNTLVPLAEDELLVSHVKEQRCIFMKQVNFDEIVQSVERGSRVDTAYDLIEIESAHPDLGTYNFFAAVCGDDPDGWYGYRAINNTSFGKYCGSMNELRVGTSTSELEIIREVQQANINAGFGTIEKLYQPASLLKYYGYSFPDVDSLPPGLKMLPFNSRDSEDDVALSYDFPHWYESYFSRGAYGDLHDKDTNTYREYKGERGVTRPREDDEQSSAYGGPSPDRRDPGSSPLRDATMGLNSPNGPSTAHERPRKRRGVGARRFVLSEAEDENGENDEVRRLPCPYPCPANGAKLAPFWQEAPDAGMFDNDFIDDSPIGEEDYVPGACKQVIYSDETGDVVCGNACNPAEQLCHCCRLGV